MERCALQVLKKLQTKSMTILLTAGLVLARVLGLIISMPVLNSPDHSQPLVKADVNFVINSIIDSGGATDRDVFWDRAIACEYDF